MPTPLRDNNITAYVNRILDRVVGDPNSGSSNNGAKEVRVAAVPEGIRDVVKAASGGGSSISGARLENALWHAHDVIVREDKSWGFHASANSVWRSLGMGGDSVLQPKEQDRAGRKDAVASRLLTFINHDRWEAQEARHFARATSVLEAGNAQWGVAYGWQVREDGDWITVPDDTSFSHALTRAAHALGRTDVPYGA